jgi:hypothetical protein
VRMLLYIRSSSCFSSSLRTCLLLDKKSHKFAWAFKEGVSAEKLQRNSGLAISAQSSALAH